MRQIRLTGPTAFLASTAHLKTQIIFAKTKNYLYHPAHNLNYRTNNAFTEGFSVNNLNELSTVTNSGTLTVEGTTGAAATSVTVNGNPAALYLDNTFAEAGFTVTNGSNSFTAIASDSLGRHSTNTVNTYLPSTVNYYYDLNGNLTNAGTRYFGYDDENQLTSVTVSNAWQSQFVYDGKMRRRIRKEFTWQGSAWVQTNEVHYIYDGNVVVQERDINNLPVTTYTRGRDLSGSLQGAGGIGGMLAMSQPSTVNPQDYYYHADGNGNITAMVNAQEIVVAKYVYDPFGNALAMGGPLAPANLYRFSSKESHQGSGLLYFLYRYYDSSLQRWPSRDPLGEPGFETLRAGQPNLLGDGPNPYTFVGNAQINSVDALGLSPGYGNPVSGPDGPVGPASPYDPNPWTPPPPPPPPQPPSCISTCISKYVLGIQVDTAVVVSGQPILRKRFVTPGSAEGTSIAGKMTDLILGDRQLPVRLPTLSGGWTRCCRLTATKSASRFVSRWIPFIGWAMLTYDASGLAGCICGCNGI